MMDMPAGPDTPEYPGDAPEQKVPQADANYRRGDPMKHCGVCIYYEGGDQCSRVQSPISGFGISDVFQMQKNPFGSRIGPQEARMINGMMNSAPDRSSQVVGVQPTTAGERAVVRATAAGPPPRLRIGNRTY